jgi:hypothetical protein
MLPVAQEARVIVCSITLNSILTRTPEIGNCCNKVGAELERAKKKVARRRFSGSHTSEIFLAIGDFSSGWPVEPEDHSFMVFLSKTRDAIHILLMIAVCVGGWNFSGSTAMSWRREMRWAQLLAGDVQTCLSSR